MRVNPWLFVGLVALVLTIGCARASSSNVSATRTRPENGREAPD